MRFGISFPHSEIGADPGVIREFVQAAEEAGYDYINVLDHVLGARIPSGPDWSRFYTRDRLFHEPLVLMGFIAGVTQRIELATAIIILPQRQTALAAKQAAEVDVLSGGRLRFGVGLGWNAVEFEALGQNFRDRGRRIEEQIEVLRTLWTRETVDFDGKWHRITDAGINPLPVQRPIPIWFGAFADPAIRRAARLGDGWFLNPRLPPGDEAKRQIALFRDAARTAGRDPDTLPLDATVHASEGPEEGWRERVRQWRDLGISHVTLRLMDCGLPSVAAHLDAMRRFRRSVADFAES